MIDVNKSRDGYVEPLAPCSSQMVFIHTLSVSEQGGLWVKTVVRCLV